MLLWLITRSASQAATGPMFSQLQKLTAPDGGPNNLFGNSVAISGDTAIVGAFAHGGPLPDEAGDGAAYIFVNAGGVWSLQQKLLPPGGPFLKGFGASVAIDGDTLVVGAPGVDLTGAAYVFVRAAGVWSQQQKLTASDAASGDAFGTSLAISGDTVIVTARFDHVGANLSQGSAYVFVRSGGLWSEQQKLTASDGGMSDFFGNSAAISGNTIVIGAQFANVVGKADQGSAYVFVRAAGVWSEQQKLTASDGAEFDHFGESVAINDDTIVVGASGDDAGAGAFQGSAYVFARTSGVWSEQQKLTSSDAGGGDGFGSSAAISGETIVVSAPRKQIGGNPFQGAAYVFVKAGGVWSEQQKLIASDGKKADGFGTSVAIDGETIVAGAPFDPVGGNDDQGSAYIFMPNTPPAITASPVTLQQGRAINDTNIATVSDNEQAASLLNVSVVSGGTATGITLTNIVNIGGAITADVAATCAATGGTVRLRVTDTGGFTSEADLQVNITPNDPPVITCPPNLIAKAATPGSAMSMIIYPLPTATDDCGVMSVVCNPPSGSSFPAGTTTVTCTATDTTGNTARCSFIITLFDVCLQDDSNPARSMLFISSGPQAGEYRFCCGGAMKTGRGVVARKGNTFTLAHNTADLRVQATVDSSTARGSALLQSPPGSAPCSITDRNIRDNSCGCGGS